MAVYFIYVNIQNLKLSIESLHIIMVKIKKYLKNDFNRKKSKLYYIFIYKFSFKHQLIVLP